MAAIEELAVKARKELGKGAAGRLRRQGWVPAVIYGHGKTPEHLALDRHALTKLLQTHHRVVNLRPEEGPSRRALIKEVQIHPITDEILHVDFQEVSAQDRVTVTVPLVFKGEPAGAKEGGVLDVHLHELEVECPVDAILEQLRVDVTALGLGGSLHVKDIPLPEGVRTLTDASLVVVSCYRPKEVTTEAAPAEAGAQEVPTQPEVITEKKREERAKEKEEAEKSGKEEKG